MRQRIARMAAALLAAVLLFPCEVSAVSAKSAIVTDAQTGRVLFEKNSNERSLIASTTKIMTALIVCEQCNVLDRVRVPKEAVGVEGSSMYLRSGEVLTVQELLYGLMLHSGNDAAVALAIYCAGTVEGFAQLMNDKAHQLGMSNSHFVNPNGLDNPEHYSTAKDLALLSAYAMQNPIFAKTVSTKSVRVGQRVLTNHNKLLWRLDGADGIKTGYTKAAGRILVSSAQRDGRRLVAVTINDPNDWQDHITLLEIGFRDYTLTQVIRKGDCLGSVEVAGGDKERVELIADQELYCSLRKDEQPQVVLQGLGFVYAPVIKDQEAGFAYVCIGDSVAGKVPLVYGDTVEQKVVIKKSLFERLLGGND